MRYFVFAAVAFVICLGTVWAGCNSSNKATMISSEEAIAIAKGRVVSDAVMTLADRDEVAVEEGSNWHVSFPLQAALDMLGGEPHVFVAKADGSIVDVYYTQ